MRDASDSAFGTDDPDEGIPRSGDVIAGKYRVNAVVGRGGMGIVVAARHQQLGQTVAIKVLSIAGLDPDKKREAAARFLREGQAAARLTSDHVVRIHDVGTLETGAPFMVMELLRGDDLANLIRRQGPAPVEVAVDYIVQACDAVAEAHRNGIVHRDLKPSNLFVTRRSDGTALVKVLDFGISKALSGTDGFEGDLTATRTVVGSPFYMSPEQVRDAKRVDVRTDIWSLGMIFYELLVGKPAFHADTLPGICAAIAADAPAPISQHRAMVPDEVAAIVMKCLEKDPIRRFQTVPELVRALQPFGPSSPASSIEYAAARIDLISSIGLGSAMIPSPTLKEMAEPPRSNTLPSPADTRGVAAGSEENAAPIVILHVKTPDDPSKTALSGASTLVSGAKPAAEAGGASAPEKRDTWWVAGVVAVTAVALAAFLLHRSPRPDPVSTDGSASSVARFSLAIESTPAGATVFDGERVVGNTPLSFSVENSRVPRSFVLKLGGFFPYTIVQGPSESSVRVLATLTPEPALAPAPSAPVSAPSTAPVLDSRGKSAPTRPPPARKKPTPSTAPGPAPGPDIRLER